nr:MAG TPA: hypothetical protein [Bacteriophage sp.]
MRASYDDLHVASTGWHSRPRRGLRGTDRKIKQPAGAHPSLV